ncbi:hypothetical protein CsSME_00010928 [Camellia sinensis var. sinensis]
MNLPLHSGAFHLRHEFPANGTLVLAKLKEPDAVRRRRALRRVDRELSKGNHKAALTLVKQLQGKPGGLRGFGSAKQVHRRISSLDELKLSGIDISYLQSLVDSILNSIERSIEFQLSEEHEAGHFLVGYLLGVLPKGYKVSNMEALRQEKFARGRVEFLGFEFLRDIDTTKILQNFSKGKLFDGANRGKISSTTLNKFLCVILGGLAAEQLVFGYSEGLHSDVEKLNRVLKWLGFTESEADSQVKWAAVNTLLILVRHQEARSKVAEAMALGKSVGSCIDIIENTLIGKEI